MLACNHTLNTITCQQLTTYLQAVQMKELDRGYRMLNLRLLRFREQRLDVVSVVNEQGKL